MNSMHLAPTSRLHRSATQERDEQVLVNKFSARKHLRIPSSLAVSKFLIFGRFNAKKKHENLRKYTKYAWISKSQASPSLLITFVRNFHDRGVENFHQCPQTFYGRCRFLPSCSYVSVGKSWPYESAPLSRTYFFSHDLNLTTKWVGRNVSQRGLAEKEEKWLLAQTSENCTQKNRKTEKTKICESWVFN